MIDLNEIKKLEKRIYEEKEVTGVSNVLIYALRVMGYLGDKKILDAITFVGNFDNGVKKGDYIQKAFKGEVELKDDFCFPFKKNGKEVYGVNLNFFPRLANSFMEMCVKLGQISILSKLPLTLINNLYETNKNNPVSFHSFSFSDFQRLVESFFKLFIFNYEHVIESDEFKRIYSEDKNLYIEINFLNSEKINEDIKKIKEDIDKRFRDLKEENKGNNEKIKKINQDLQNIKAEFKHFLKAFLKGDFEEAKKQNKWVKILKKIGSNLVFAATNVAVTTYTQKLLGGW